MKKRKKSVRAKTFVYFFKVLFEICDVKKQGKILVEDFYSIMECLLINHIKKEEIIEITKRAIKELKKSKENENQIQQEIKEINYDDFIFLLK